MAVTPPPIKAALEQIPLLDEDIALVVGAGQNVQSLLTEAQSHAPVFGFPDLLPQEKVDELVPAAIANAKSIKQAFAAFDQVKAALDKMKLAEPMLDAIIALENLP